MYQNGKIYKIVSDNTDKIYIGSTCNPLYKRLYQHKTSYKRFQKTNQYMSSYEILKFEDCKIILIEDFPCERKEQLTAKERYYIELNKDICVNIVIPTRTNKEYREQNTDKIREIHKKYYEQNKDNLKERVKEYREQNKDNILEYQKEYYEQNKDNLKARAKEYYEQNKEKIREQRNMEIICECGSKSTKIHINRHYKSIKHIKWVEQNQC